MSAAFWLVIFLVASAAERLAELVRQVAVGHLEEAWLPPEDDE